MAQLTFSEVKAFKDLPKILQFYLLRCLCAPSCGAEEEDNDGFYEQLQLQSSTSHSVT